MHVLHVEDNPVDADLTARMLARAAPGISLDLAPTHAAALERLREPAGYDLALIDLSLPDGSGLDILAQIRERALPLAVVMLTGFGDQEAAIAALRAGADDYLAKGEDTYDRLPTTLSNALERSRAARKRRQRPLRAIYAEHNASDVDLTRRHLARYAPHIRLTVVGSVEQLMQRLPSSKRGAQDFDVVLIDYHLPGLDALDAVKLIRVERELELPIVMVSGQGSEEVAARAIHLGVDDYITKHPGYLHKLPATLEKVHSQALFMRESASLQEATKRLELILATSPVILYTRELETPDCRFSWVSENVTRILGFSPQTPLEPEGWLSHVHPDDRAAMREHRAVLSGQGTSSHDYRLLDARGRLRWIRDEVRLPDARTGGPNLATGALRDISDAKVAELTQATRLEVLDGLLAHKPLDDILAIIQVRLAEIHPDLRVEIRLADTASNDPDPGCANTHGERLEIPFRGTSGDILGHVLIRYRKPRAPSTSALGVIGELAYLAGIAVGRTRDDATLRQAAAVFESSREGVVITDLDGRIVTVNRAYSEITGYAEAEVLGQRPSIARSGRHDSAFYRTLWASLLRSGHWQGEVWNRRKNGEIYPQLLSISTVYDSNGDPTHYVGVMTDISQLRRSEAKIERLVHYDPLTDLPNRRLIQSRIQHALSHAERAKQRIALLFLDLDRFKTVNDSLGHPAGDALLVAITARLRERLRDHDTLGRLGGDELVVILEGLRRPEDAAGVAQTLLELLEQPFVLPTGHELFISASIGISLYPDDGRSATELVKHADVAMYQAKEDGRNTYRFYTPALTRAANERLDLEARLRRALANDEFVLHFQPQFEVASGRLIGCEALVRWESPEEGLIPPIKFIPLAEETGLIGPLGEWVLASASAQAKAWAEAGLDDLQMAINLSARQVQREDLAERVRTVLERTGLAPRRLTLELTESIIMGQGEGAVDLLHSLKALGVRLSIDDFGTGYSSLAYLKRFPIDELKIDSSFVRDIPRDKNDMEIAATIIAMARGLHLQVVAEGVETEAQLAFLSKHDCHACQGFLLGRPMPAEDFLNTFVKVRR